MGAAAGFDGGDACVGKGGVGVEKIGVFAIGQRGTRWVLVRFVGLNWGWEGGGSRVGEEGGLPSEDVVGDCGDGVFVTELEAKLEHQGCFAGANRSAVEEGGGWSVMKRT